jgi:uncharacterized protein YkwD
VSNRSHHLFWVLAALLGFCCGCPSVSDTTLTDDSARSVPTLASQANDTGSNDILSTKAAPACVQVGDPATNIHQQMLDQLNTYRIQNGLKPLIYSKTLEFAANAQAKDLYARNFFDHINPDGKDPGQRALDADFCSKYVGENIAEGQISVDAVMLAWKNSPHHNENMLHEDYVYVGMGHYVDPTGRQYWAQEFALDVP